MEAFFPSAKATLRGHPLGPQLPATEEPTLVGRAWLRAALGEERKATQSSGPVRQQVLN